MHWRSSCVQGFSRLVFKHGKHPSRCCFEYACLLVCLRVCTVVGISVVVTMLALLLVVVGAFRETTNGAAGREDAFAAAGALDRSIAR